MDYGVLHYRRNLLPSKLPSGFLGPTVWLSGSGGMGETPLNYRAISGKPRLRGAAKPLSDWRYVLSRASIPEWYSQLAVSKNDFDPK
jgi:hypothetical protein